MGYYDQSYRKKKRKSTWIVPLLTGIILGGIVLLVVVPDIFLNHEDGRDTNQATSTEQTSPEIESSPNVQPLQVDVSTQLTDVVSEVTPAVVGITNLQRGNDFWSQEEGVEAGTGSGVIYKLEGDTAYVVTNHHVIEGADTVEVVMHDETHIEAEIIGSDIFTDLAVLRMDGSEVDTVIEMGTSSTIKVGEPAIAIGNPLGLYLSSTVTQGVISGKERTIPMDFDMDGRADWQAEVIQTDAAINPGNSGGALININGHLIGINSMKINEDAVEGIGFAIPIDSALPVIEELETTGEVTRPYLGVEIYSLEELPQYEWRNSLNLPQEVTGGVYVWTVERLSPADKAGLQELDVIVEMDGEPIHNMIDLRKILYQEKEIGDEVELTIYRDGRQMNTTITLGSQ